MKKTITVLSVVSGLVAILAVVLNIQVIFGGESYFFRFAMFSMMRSGGAMGYLGNLLSMLIVAAGFGGMCLSGLKAVRVGGMKAVRSSLIAGGLMTLLSVISLICSIAGGMFNFGDIVILLMPAVYTFLIFSGSDRL